MKFTLFTLGLLLVLGNLSASEIKFEKNRFFVKLNNGAKFPTTSQNIVSKKLYENLYVVQTKDMPKAILELKENKEVKKIEKSYYSQKSKLEQPSNSILISDPADTPFEDPKTSRLWGFYDSSDGGMDINKAYFSPLPIVKKEVIVAVVDTGVDYNHEDLKEIMWINKEEIAGNGIDDDQNGYIDDIYGINTLVRDANGNATTDPRHSHAHGTHVSGTIAAKQNNGIGISGVASNVKIMALRTVPDTSDETDIDIVEAFIYAAKNGAKIINCSFGKKNNEGGMVVSETIEYIGKTYGVLVIASAGNDSTNIDTNLKYPASFENDHLLVVSSTAKGGSLSYFSNYGIKNADIAAPGSDILSTIPGNMYDTYSGTSMASPNTSGVAAEVLSHFPELGPLELKKLLMDSVYKTEQLKTRTVSGGIVNLYQALQLGFDKY